MQSWCDVAINEPPPRTLRDSARPVLPPEGWRTASRGRRRAEGTGRCIGSGPTSTPRSSGPTAVL